MPEKQKGTFMNSRKTRLPEIIEILIHQVISSQEELSKQLAVRGHIITQATLSRDLKLLKASKVSDDRGNYRYILGDSRLYGIPRGKHKPAIVTAAEPSQSTASGIHSSVLSVDITGNLVVIKTRNGYASGLAYDIDTLDSDIVLGTIPGADTVFVAIRENTSREHIFNFLSSFLPMEVMQEARPAFFADDTL